MKNQQGLKLTSGLKITFLLPLKVFEKLLFHILLRNLRNWYIYVCIGRYYIGISGTNPTTFEFTATTPAV
jgi:hypothetical protein